MPLVRVKMERSEKVESEDSESEDVMPKIGHPHSPDFREGLGSSVARKEIMTSAYDWLILRQLPKTVSGQMNCSVQGLLESRVPMHGIK